MRSNTTARTARRRTLRIAAAALTAAAGLSLTACSGSDITETKPAAHADTGKAAAESSGAGSATGEQGADAQPGPGAKDGAKAGASGKQSGGAQAAAGGGGGAGSSVERCHTSGLKASFATGGDAAPDPDADGATTTSIVLTNKGGSTCKIGGFPGVDLKTENGGGVWSLQRSSAKSHGAITLKPGDSTNFTINLALTKEEEGFWQPAFAVVTPPNETTSLTLDWPWGALVDQRGATRPATFVNPIG
ncbi:DUF4232 domain-containing protein [Streptomyces sp. NPDC093589]|uniref:DUF4232 domain-containing protein n=1 Tax=Streptomyces sp. NPDC093589 TaxID=3366043 RepID=UPI0038035BBD